LAPSMPRLSRNEMCRAYPTNRQPNQKHQDAQPGTNGDPTQPRVPIPNKAGRRQHRAVPINVILNDASQSGPNLALTQRLIRGSEHGHVQRSNCSSNRLTKCVCVALPSTTQRSRYAATTAPSEILRDGANWDRSASIWLAQCVGPQAKS